MLISCIAKYAASDYYLLMALVCREFRTELARRRYCPTTSYESCAAHLELIKLAVREWGVRPLTMLTFTYQNLACLQWLCGEYHIHWNRLQRTVIENAVRIGAVDVVRWLREQCYPPCPASYHIVVVTVCYEQKEVARYLAESEARRIQQSRRTGQQHTRTDQQLLDISSDRLLGMALSAVQHEERVLQKLEILELFDFPIHSPEVAKLAASLGRLDIIKWLRHPDRLQHGGRWAWNAAVCAQAARHGHLDVLRWARHPDREARDAEGNSIWGGRCPWNTRTQNAYLERLDIETV